MSGTGQFDRRLAAACLRAAADGPFFPDWEFETLTGASREEVRANAGMWESASPPTSTMHAIARGGLTNLLGYPHGRAADLCGLVGHSREDLNQLLAALRRAQQTEDER